MSNLDLRALAAGSFLLGAALFLLTWLGSVSESLSWPWVVQLSMHGLTFVLLAVGFFLAGRQTEAADRLTIVWWVGAALTVLGSTVGWLVFTTGLVVVGIVEVLRGRRFIPAALVLGATALTVVYLRGAHMGDESSRRLVGLERPLIIVGLAMVAIGLSALGGQQLRTSSPGSTP